MATACKPCPAQKPCDSSTASTDYQDDKRIIFVIGGPGSGKKTQCDLIIEKFGFAYLSTGDLLRDEVASKSPRGITLKEVMEKGESVPMNILLDLLREAIHQKADKNCPGFVIDGFPLELKQAKQFEIDIATVEAVMFLKVSDETMKERILERGKSSGRQDDNEETAKKRISAFKKANQPIIKYYTKEKKLCEICAENSIDEVFSAVVESMEKSHPN